MNTLIVSATKAEVQPLMEEWKYASDDGILYSPQLAEVLFPDIFVSGPGLINTVYHLGKILYNKKYDLIINVGIAGSFRRDLALGETVQVISDCFSDMGAEDDEGFLSIFEMGILNKDDFPFRNGLLYANFSPSVELKKMSGISVNTVHGKDANILKIVNRLHPDIESMEGAAVFFVALMEGLACMQFRSISNYVERRNREAWSIPLAIENLNRFLIEGIKKNHFNINL